MLNEMREAVTSLHTNWVLYVAYRKAPLPMLLNDLESHFTCWNCSNSHTSWDLALTYWDITNVCYYTRIYRTCCRSRGALTESSATMDWYTSRGGRCLTLSSTRCRVFRCVRTNSLLMCSALPCGSLTQGWTPWYSTAALLSQPCCRRCQGCWTTSRASGIFRRLEAWRACEHSRRRWAAAVVTTASIFPCGRRCSIVHVHQTSVDGDVRGARCAAFRFPCAAVCVRCSSSVSVNAQSRYEPTVVFWSRWNSRQHVVSCPQQGHTFLKIKEFQLVFCEHGTAVGVVTRIVAQCMPSFSSFLTVAKWC